MMEKYGMPMDTTSTSATHAQAAANPPPARWVCTVRLPLPLTRR